MCSVRIRLQTALRVCQHALQGATVGLSLEQLDAPVVMDFLDWLEKDRGNGVSTRNARLVAIKSFMAFLEYRLPSAVEQSRQIRAIPAKKTSVPLVSHLDRSEIRALLDAPDPTTCRGIRDRAMLHLCYAAGLRVSELVSLPMAGLSLSPSPVIRVTGKGRRERALPIWKETANDLRKWVALRVTKPGVGELFVNAHGLPMTRSGFEAVLAKHVITASICAPSLTSKHVSPHVLRHYLPCRTMSSSLDWNYKRLRNKESFRRNTRATRHSQRGLQAVQEPQQIVVGPKAG